MSCNNLSIYDDSTADTGSKCYHNDILTALGTALPHLTESCNVGIISYLDRKPGQVAKLGCHINDSPAQVDADIYHAIAAYRSRNTDSDSLYLALGNAFLRQLIINCLCNI